jgi:hypothetical protein
MTSNAPTTFRVIVKGTPADARAAATRHTVVLNNVRHRQKGRDDRNDIAPLAPAGETYADATPLAGWDAMHAWFAEGPKLAPFPAGTLLWFGTSEMP